MNLNKILKTLAEHEKVTQESADITKRIGESISSCPLPNDDGLSTEYGIIPNTDEKTGKEKTHLWYALQETTPINYYHEERRLNDGEITDYLDESECEHCINAWRLIQERKEIRKRLGIAKRSIRMYGKQAIKQLESGNE